MDNYPRVLITVLSMNHINFTKLALKYLWKNTDKKHIVLVVDNGSNEETLEWLRYTRDAGSIELIENGENLGIAGSINIGMRLAQERNMDFCFYSNDLVAGFGWLEALQEGTYKSDKISGASPYIGPEATYDEFVNMDFRNNYRQNVWPRLKSEPSAEELEQIVDDLHGGNFQDFTENWFETRKEVPPLYEWFSMCMYIKKSAIETVGLFDVRFFPSHFEDLDWMVRSNNEGLYRIGVTGSYLFHFSTITTRAEFGDGDKDLRAKANDNERKFNEKWRIFLPYEQRREGIRDGDKFLCWQRGPRLEEFFPVSDLENSRNHDKWQTWEQYNKEKNNN